MGHLENHSLLYFSIKELMERQAYDFASIKCWTGTARYLQFIPCHDALGETSDTKKYSLLPEDYGQLLCQLIDSKNYLWLKKYRL